MAKFRVVLKEIQTYEVYVEATTPSEAEDIACDIYGEDGDICDTEIELADIEEVNEDE
jgi:hypothetical protein